MTLLLLLMQPLQHSTFGSLNIGLSSFRLIPLWPRHETSSKKPTVVAQSRQWRHTQSQHVKYCVLRSMPVAITCAAVEKRIGACYTPLNCWCSSGVPGWIISTIQMLIGRSAFAFATADGSELTTTRCVAMRWDPYLGVRDTQTRLSPCSASSTSNCIHMARWGSFAWTNRALRGYQIWLRATVQ